MKVVYSTSEFVPADLVQAMLRGNNIESQLQNEGANMWGVGLALLEITVREDDFQRAELLIRENPGPATVEIRSEGEALKRRVAAFRRQRAWVLLAVFLVPTAIILTSVGLTGDWEPAILKGILLLTLVAVGLGVSFLVKRASQRRRQGPSNF